MVTKRTFRRNLASACSALSVAGLLASTVLAAGVPAGIIIENTAEATFDDAGVTRTATSNTVQVRVDELLDVAAASLSAGPVTARPGPAVLSFLVSNTGNGPEAFLLEAVTAVAGNDFDAVLDAIAADTNNNGSYDPGIDQILPAPATTTNIAADAAQTIFVLVTIPAGVADGDQSTVNLIARPATGSGPVGTVFAGAGEGGGDAVIGLSAGQAFAAGQIVASASTVTLVKWASVADPFGGSTAVPGSIITYSIQALVTGSAQINDLVVTDAIPAGTQYRANSLIRDSAPLTDAVDGDAGEASAAGIRVNLENLSGGSSSTVSFAVLIDQ